MNQFNTKKTVMAVAISLALGLGLTACGGSDDAPATNSWMSASIIAEQAAAKTDTEKEAVANKRAKQLIAAMTLEQKMQQLTGATAETLPELPQCYGGRHIAGIAALNIPTQRVTNGPVGLGQNDCVDIADKSNVYVSTTSAKATALPSAIGAAASFDPSVAAAYGDIIGTEMENLALHIFEAPGLNMARLPVLGRNFEYFGEDPYLTGKMGAAEVTAIQAKGMLAMPKHFVGNEQETNRTTIQETIDEQVLREIYLLPFEMAVKDAKPASIMCAYNYVNGISSCESKEMLTNVLRNEWGFSGYVQSDFYAMKSTTNTMLAGMDNEMPTPTYWTKSNLTAALASGAITTTMIDKALERRFTQLFKYGVFDRALKQTPIDFTANGAKARDIGVKASVLLQNNSALPFDAKAVKKVVLIGKQTQIYAQQVAAGGALVGKPLGSSQGSSDVVPNYTVAPLDGIKNVLKAQGSTASVQLILVNDANSSATIDGTSATFAQAMSAAAGADAVIIMAGTIAEEGSDRATFTATDGKTLASSAAAGTSLDWYTDSVKAIGTNTTSNPVKNSNTFAMIKTLMETTSTSGKSMPQKTALVLKDNASISLPNESWLVGASGPAILETWFPGQEDGNIAAQLLFGKDLAGKDVSPTGKLPITFPYATMGFLDKITASQYPGVVAPDGVSRLVSYTENLEMGYRWYDARQKDGSCVTNPDNSNACVAFPFGHGLSYNTKTIVGTPTVTSKVTRISMSDYRTTHTVKATVTNGDSTKSGTEVVQIYVSLPQTSGTNAATQPPKRLVGFQKVSLAAGESKELTFTINSTDTSHPLSVWSKDYKLWAMPSGTVTFHVGKSSSPRDLKTATATQ